MTTTQIVPTTPGLPDPYAHLKAAVPGRRPQKLMFDLTLLLEPDGTEYCFAEARARHLGLLGKKWPPPPPPNAAVQAGLASPSGDENGRERSVKVDFNDQGTKNSRAARRQSVTVTINTKEALADVLDMYNSTNATLPEPVPLKPETLHASSNLRTPAAKPQVFQDENAMSTGTKPKG
jgi:checkpoint serine/threonine-protein kinase